MKTGKKQVVIASELGISQGSLNNILKKRGVSLAYMEEIAEKINLDLADMLQEGRAIVEGEMLSGTSLSARNSQDQLPGDYLATVLGFAKLSNGEASNRTGISLKDLDDLLESKRKPTFDEMEALYFKLGINPSYFFDGNEHWMWWPEDELLRLFIALNKTGHIPDRYDLEEIFGIEKDEAKEFMAKRSEWAAEGRFLPIPFDWLDRIRDRYYFDPSWVIKGDPPLAIHNANKVNMETLAGLETENKKLQADNESLTDDYREAVRRQNLLQDKLDSLRSEKDASGLADVGYDIREVDAMMLNESSPQMDAPAAPGGVLKG